MHVSNELERSWSSAVGCWLKRLHTACALFSLINLFPSPGGLTAHNLTLPIDVKRLMIRRAESQSGSELYAEAQRQLAALVAGLPEDDQYPALPGPWDEALKG